MNISRPMLALALAAAGLGGVWLASHGSSFAQFGQVQAPTAPTVNEVGNITDWLLKPVRLPFAQGKSLEDVAAYLRKELKANVVLDLAALDRLELKPTDKVRLDLDGVRLKTGLKLLLDQVNLTTRVIPEDNLLIITDASEANEPIVRVLEEIKALHRDLHAVQDDVRDIRMMIEAPIDDEGNPRMRNPTIIEEMPPAEGDAPRHDSSKKSKEKPTRTRPGV